MNARWNELASARIARVAYVTTIASLLGACKAAPPATPPPPEVRVVSVAAQPIANIIEVPGRLQAVRTAEVRGRVDGIVQRRLYTEGTDVAEGQPLFAIDPRELRARLSAAHATLARAEATASNAKQDVTRYQGLVAQQAISQQEYDAAVARQRTADADVAQARAQVEAANLSLSYTTVTAPIAGRAGRAEVTEGALVSAGSATLLTKIEQIDPIYANFSQSSAEMLALRRGSAAGGAQPLAGVAVRLVLEDGSVYPLAGHLNFLDLSVDEATGTTALRAEFRNPSRALLPGQFVRARIEAGVQAGGMQLPQRAVTVTPQGASVMVVSAKNVVEARAVKVGALNGDAWVIESGLAVGERVIVDGLQQVQPGKVVTVVTTPAKAVPNAAGDAPAAAPGR
jgi:membrane fusion protein (multidrug efflux system)